MAPVPRPTSTAPPQPEPEPRQREEHSRNLSSRLFGRAAAAGGRTSVSTEHLLLALATEGEGVAATVLRNLGADVAIRGLLQLLPEEGKEEPSEESATRPGCDQSLGELLDRAQDLATREESAATGASHLLLAMAAQDSPVARFIREPDARLAEIPRAVRDVSKRKEEAIRRADYENAARHRAEEKRLREEFHQAMNAWRDSPA